MTQEQFENIVAISDRLRELKKVKRNLQNKYNSKLTFNYKYEDGDKGMYADYELAPIAEIIEKHQQMIYDEIDEEIGMLQKSIETL